MKKPLLSIIITTHGNDYDLRNYYNIEDYSLFKHFYEPIEIIIAEDLIDEEPSYIKNLNARGLNISYVFSEISGIANNRTNGLFNANGKYVTFVDSPDSLDFHFSDVSELLEKNYDVITFTTEVVKYDIFTIPNIWGKFFKTDLLKNLGGFYYGWNGWWEEGTSQAVFRYNKGNMKLKHLALKSEKIKYEWLNNSVHTVGHFPSEKEIYAFLKKSKHDFYPHKKQIYFDHLTYVEQLIKCNHDRFVYNYNDLNSFCSIEKKRLF